MFSLTLSLSHSFFHSIWNKSLNLCGKLPARKRLASEPNGLCICCGKNCMKWCIGASSAPFASGEQFVNDSVRFIQLWNVTNNFSMILISIFYVKRGNHKRQNDDIVIKKRKRKTEKNPQHIPKLHRDREFSKRTKRHATNFQANHFRLLVFRSFFVVVCWCFILISSVN